MGIFSDAVLGGLPPPQPDAQPAKGAGRFARPIPIKAPSFSDALLNPGPAPQEDVKPSEKDLVDDSSKALGFKGQAVGSFASDDKEWVRNAAHYLYPDQPIEESIKRFGQTKEGRWYHKGDDDKLYHVTPYAGMARLNNIGAGVGPALPAAGGATLGILTAPAALTGVGLVGTMGAAGVGAVGGEVARQKIGDWLLGDAAVSKDINVPEVIKEGVNSTFGQGIGMGLGQLFTRNAVPDIGAYSQPATNRILQLADQYGVRLTPGEATNLASLIAEQKRLQGVPQSANIMRTFSQERNREAVNAFNQFLGRLGQAQDPSVLGRTASETAQAALQNAQNARTNAVDPFYAQAAQQIQRVDIGNVLQHIDQQLVHAKGPIQRALQTMREYLTVPGANGSRARVADQSFQGLNNAKMAIDALMDNPELAARHGIDRTAYREMAMVRDRLVAALDNAAGNQGAYQAGRQAYQQMTQQEVEPLRQALQPLLNGSRDNANLSMVARNLFDPGKRSPEQVAAARQIMTQQAPDLWNSLVRQFVREEAATAMKTMADGEMRNVAGGISKQLGDEFTSANLRAAMSPQQFRDYEGLMDVFRAAARAMDSNSDTAFKQEMIKRARNAAGGNIARITRNLNPAKLIENASEFFANRNYDRQAEAVANIITSGDRDALLRIRQLRQLAPDDWRRYAVLGHLLERGGAFAVNKAMGE